MNITKSYLDSIPNNCGYKNISIELKTPKCNFLHSIIQFLYHIK